MRQGVKEEEVGVRESGEKELRGRKGNKEVLGRKKRCDTNPSM